MYIFRERGVAWMNFLHPRERPMHHGAVGKTGCRPALQSH